MNKSIDEHQIVLNSINYERKIWNKEIPQQCEKKS